MSSRRDPSTSIADVCAAAGVARGTLYQYFDDKVDLLRALAEQVTERIIVSLEMRPVLMDLGEVRRAMENLREAEILAQRLDDDRRQGRVCAVLANAHSHLGELDEALAAGTRGVGRRPGKRIRRRRRPARAPARR